MLLTCAGTQHLTGPITQVQNAQATAVATAVLPVLQIVQLDAQQAGVLLLQLQLQPLQPPQQPPPLLPPQPQQHQQPQQPPQQYSAQANVQAKDTTALHATKK